MKSIAPLLISACTLALAGFLLSAPAGAAPPVPFPVAGEIAGMVDIPVEEWRAMADGRTLTYRINGEVWAREYYYPGTNHVSLQRPNGQCMNGTWEYNAPHYCYHWDLEGTACFRHVRGEDAIWVIQTEMGVDTPQVQEMSGISDVPLICAPQGTS